MNPRRLSHLHPVADPLFDGVWHFSFTPNLAGKYQAFLDFIPLKSPSAGFAFFYFQC